MDIAGYSLTLIEILYIIFSSTVVIAGFSMVGVAVGAYRRTRRKDMIFISIGFGLLVSASIGTAISAFLTAFSNPSLMLSVNNMVVTVGFLFIMYSLITPE